MRDEGFIVIFLFLFFYVRLKINGANVVLVLFRYLSRRL